jgi:RNA polymerase sigma-70 factor, ECF subfamily
MFNTLERALTSKGADRVGCGAISTRSDAELMADMLTANGEALETLFGRYVRLIRRVAVDILRDRGEAEDVTQEVFLEIYRKAHLYDPSRGSVRVWLLQYAYHRTLRRKAALRRRASYRGEPLDHAEAPVDAGRNLLTRDECRWVIRSGLARLPERQRATLELACFEELSLRDVADRLGVSVGCTRHYYYRGLARLRAWARFHPAPQKPRVEDPELHPAPQKTRGGLGDPWTAGTRPGPLAIPVLVGTARRGASGDDRADAETGRGRRPRGRTGSRSLPTRR